MLIPILIFVLGSMSLPVTSQRMQESESSALELADRSTYNLGPGDIVTVVVEGGSSQILLSAGVSPWATYTVGGDGYLSVSGIGAVSVDGLTIDESQQSLQRIASGYYPSIRVTLSLHEPRALRVNVGGMVNLPGTYILTALDRVSDAVLMAEGISAFGSRSGVVYTDDGDTLDVDLNIRPGSLSYVSDPFLSNNAGILINVCVNPIYILSTNAALQTREHQPGEDFESLLIRMGGVSGNIDLPASLIIREKTAIPVWDPVKGFTETEILAGDTLMLVTLRDSVTVGGAVTNPGIVPFDPESTVMDYIISAGGPLSTASSRIIVQRNGQDVEIEGDIEKAHLLPGDYIDIKYNWFNRNAAMISLITSAISIGITIYALNN